MEGAQQIAAPSLVATLAICIVFVPILFLSGAAGSLFKPLALAVVYAMIASYLLSRTFVPVMCKLLLGSEVHLHTHNHKEGEEGKRGRGGEQSNDERGRGNKEAKPTSASSLPQGDIVWRIHQVFNRFFDIFLGWYRQQLHGALRAAPGSRFIRIAVRGFGPACCPSSGRTFFRPWTRGNSACMFAPRRGRASKRPNGCSPAWSCYSPRNTQKPTGTHARQHWPAGRRRELRVQHDGKASGLRMARF